MTDSIKAVTATIQLSDTLSIDGYMLPDGEFRAGIAGASVLLGHGKDWFNRLASKAPNKLQALQSVGFTGYVKSHSPSERLAMTDSVKASRATIQLGSLAVDGFMLPDGSYRMSQTQAAECVNMTERNAREFLDSKTFKSLTGEGYTTAIFEIESETQARGQSRFRALPLEVVVIYWVYQCYRGNKQAFNLLVALATESLERRFDAAFGVNRTETERDSRLTQRIQQMERELKMLGDAYAIEDDIRMQRDYFERLLREHGIDPWEIPGDGS